MAGRQQNTTSSLPHTNQVTGRRGTEETILAHEQLLDTVSCTDLRNFLDNLRVEVTAITGDDEGSTFSSFGDGLNNAGDEGFGVVGLLEDLDLLSKTRAEENDNC